jgi:subtilisin family serine protease
LSAGAAARRTPAHPGFAPGEVLVLLPPEIRFARGAHGETLVPDARRAGALARLGLTPARMLAAAGGTLAGRVAVLRSPRSDFDPAAASAELRASGLFAAACPNYRFAINTTIPNDLHVPDQWYVQGSLGEDIRLPLAWDVEKGSASVRIAILDTGVDTGHPDLESKIWVNPGEIPGNGIDDDGNGFIDDVTGWDFGNNDNDPNPSAMFDEIGLDEGFHGTMCAGIAAAATNNSEGMAGAGWNCRIMPLRVADSTGAIGSDAIANAFGYAILEGASVISMSFGAPDQPGLRDFFQGLVDAARDADIVCVAAAGNDSTDTPLVYPAACDHVIAVGATDETNQRADFSNFGPWVDVAAPGSLMLSTLCRNYEIDELSQIFYFYFFGWDLETPYMYGDGTSFACPLVAGVCGLIRSHYPGLGPDAVAARLISTGDAVAYDHPIGPKVNAYRAIVEGLAAVEPAARLAPGLAPPSPNPTTGSTRLAFTIAESGPAELALFDTAGRRVRTLDTGFQSAGTHQSYWDGTDAEGRRVAAGIYFARLTARNRTDTVRLVRLDR